MLWFFANITIPMNLAIFIFFLKLAITFWNFHCFNHWILHPLKIITYHISCTFLYGLLFFVCNFIRSRSIWINCMRLWECLRKHLYLRRIALTFYCLLYIRIIYLLINSFKLKLRQIFSIWNNFFINIKS